MGASRPSPLPAPARGLESERSYTSATCSRALSPAAAGALEKRARGRAATSDEATTLRDYCARRPATRPVAGLGFARHPSGGSPAGSIPVVRDRGELIADGERSGGLARYTSGRCWQGGGRCRVAPPAISPPPSPFCLTRRPSASIELARLGKAIQLRSISSSRAGAGVAGARH